MELVVAVVVAVVPAVVVVVAVVVGTVVPNKESSSIKSLFRVKMGLRRGSSDSGVHVSISPQSSNSGRCRGSFEHGSDLDASRTGRSYASSSLLSG